MRYEGIWQHWIQHSNNAISLCRWLVLWSTCVCSCVLEEAWLWRVICRQGGILCFQSLIAISSLSEITYPTFNINQTTTKDKEKISPCSWQKNFCSFNSKKIKRKFNSYSEDNAVLFYIWLFNFYSRLLTEYFRILSFLFVCCFFIIITDILNIFNKFCCVIENCEI